MERTYSEIIKPIEPKPFKDGFCKKCDKIGGACKTHSRTEITRRCAIQGLKYCLKNVKKQKYFYTMDCSENHKDIVKITVEVINPDWFAEDKNKEEVREK